MTRSLTSGPIGRELISLALPLLAGNIFQQLYNTVDAVIIGRWVSPDAFGAVGVAGTVMNLFLFVLSGACTGVSVLFSQLYGSRDLSGFRREFFQAALFGSLFTVGLSLTSLCLLSPMLTLIRTPAELVGYIRDYLRVIFGGLLAAFAYNLCSSALRAVGDTLASLCFLGLSIMTNVGLDLLLVAGLEWGIAGAAWATVASQSLAAVLSLAYVRIRYPQLLFGRREMVVDRDLLGRTVRFSAVAALHQSSLYIGKLLVQGAVNTLGTPSINAYTAALRIEGFANSFGDSGAAASAVFIGQNTGAKETDRITQGFCTGRRMMLVLGAVMSVVMFVGASPLCALILPGSDPLALEFSVSYLRTISLFYLLCFTGCTYVGYFQGIGRVDIPAMGSAMHISLRALLSWLLVGRLGLKAVALATGLGWMLIVFFLTLVFRGVLFSGGRDAASVK